MTFIFLIFTIEMILLSGLLLLTEGFSGQQPGHRGYTILHYGTYNFRHFPSVVGRGNSHPPVTILNLMRCPQFRGEFALVGFYQQQNINTCVYCEIRLYS